MSKYLSLVGWSTLTVILILVPSISLAAWTSPPIPLHPVSNTLESQPQKGPGRSLIDPLSNPAVQEETVVGFETVTPSLHKRDTPGPTSETYDIEHSSKRPGVKDVKESAKDLEKGYPADLTTRTSMGTAWPISSGFVLTNDHILSSSNRAILISSHGQEIPAWAVLRDEMTDIAVLKVSDPRTLPPALPLARSEARLGATVFTIGFPRFDIMGRAPKLSSGVISGEKGLLDDPSRLQTTVPIQPGNSGGPLLNMNGEVVGVVTSMLGIRDEATGTLVLMQNVSCAVNIKGVKELLTLLPEEASQIDVLPTSAEGLETLANRTKDSVLIVIAR